MYCLINMCYVCLEKKDKALININSSLSAYKDIIHIIGYLPFNLDWMKTKRIALICEECCLRLRKTYQFLATCLKNSALLQGYMDKLNTASISNTDNEAELHVDLVHEIKLEDKEIYRFGPIIEETEDVFIFVKEEDTWNKKEVDDKEESPMDSNSTASNDNETDSEISVNSNIHVTVTDSNCSEFTCKQVHSTNKKELNTAAKKIFKCLTCSKYFCRKALLDVHARKHTGEKPYSCDTCEKSFIHRSSLVRHMRIHTGEKPHERSRCKKYFDLKTNLVRHMRNRINVLFVKNASTND